MSMMLKRWVFVLSSGYVLVFYSELLFWGASTVTGFITTWLFYSLAGYLFLAVIAHFRVNTVGTLFLAGAIYGWLVEGVLVATTYEQLPISISDTGLSWHMLLTVGVGWYALRRALLQRHPFSAALWSAAIGVFAGLWLPFWGFEEIAGEVSPFTLTRLSWMLGAAVPVLAGSYWIQNQIAPAPRAPNRWEIGIVIGVFAAQFLGAIVPVYPIALVVLPLLLAIVFIALRRHRQNNIAAPTYLAALSGKIPPANLLSIFVMIPAALLAFAVNQALNLTPLPQYAIYLLIVPGGFVVLAVSWYKVWRANPTRT